jgi:hypothetical protein
MDSSTDWVGGSRFMYWQEKINNKKKRVLINIYPLNKWEMMYNLCVFLKRKTPQWPWRSFDNGHNGQW